MTPQFVPSLLVVLTGLLGTQTVGAEGVGRPQGVLHAFSRTAQAVTGDITLTPGPATRDGPETVTVTFATGRETRLLSEGEVLGHWDGGDTERQHAEILRFEQDPGGLLQDNTLCGNVQTHPARYAALYQADRVGDGGRSLIGLAVFTARVPPSSIDSDGLCATYYYEH